MRFSFINVALQALKHNSGWPEQWRNPEPKAAYDARLKLADGRACMAKGIQIEAGKVFAIEEKELVGCSP